MFKKRIKVFAILFSVFLMVVIGVAVINNELDIYHAKEQKVDKIIRDTKTDSEMYLSWATICSLKESLVLSEKKILNELINKVEFKKNVYRWKEDDTLCYLDPFDVAMTPHLQNRVNEGEFVPVDVKEAISFYREQMLALTAFFPGFQPWHYFMKLLFVLAISSIPSLLAFLSSAFAVSFPITVPVTAIVLLLFTMIQGYADDTTIVKLMTSSTGDENNLTLGMLHLTDKSGALIILPQKGIWGAYGPVWKFSKGMIFSPVGIICGKGENGTRVEYLSLWSISSVNIGEFNHVLMGSYNHSLVKDRSPFASFKETLYYTVSKLQPGLRIDYLFQKTKEWKTKISIGPTLKFVKKKFAFHIHASITRPYTIKTEWELAF